MMGAIRTTLRHRMRLHTCATDGPSQMLRKKVVEAERARKMRKHAKRNEFVVNVPETTAFLDTLPMPTVLTAVAIALFAKVLMMVRKPRR